MSIETELQTAALDYVRRGWALTWFDYGKKFPTHPAWNTPGEVVTTPEAARLRWNGTPQNIGLVHGLGAVKTCSFDADQVERTRAALAEFGIDLEALRGGAPCVVGNPANFRLLYRQPPGLDLPLVKLEWPARDGKSKVTIFELRAGPNQDVLPPSLHPNGYPYRWAYSLPDDPAAMPEPPAALLELWRNWTAWESELKAACPWAKAAEPKAKPHRKADGARLDIIGQFNAAHDVRELLEAHGYQPRGKNRYLPPNSTSGVPSVRILDSGKVYSSNGSCPLNDSHAHDAFSAFCVLEHRGDVRAAVKTAAELLGIELETSKAAPAPEATADDSQPERPQGHGGQLMVREKRDGSIEVIANLNNAVYLLSKTAEWKGVVGYNQFRQRIEKRLPTPYGGPAGPWSDWDTAESIIWLARVHNVSLTRDLLDFAVLTVANRQAFNPAQERLRALAKQWDGIPRLSYWLEEVLGAKVDGNREYLAEIGAAWLKGATARVLIPGCKHDDVLVARSPQGWLKSTAAQAIADAIQPDSFTDSVDLNNLAEAKIQIRGIIIAELSELAGLSRGDIESIKAFVTTKVDHFREKFGRHAQDFPRTCSFFGTTNDPAFLKDPTGNRRWWPVTLEEPIDIPRLEDALPQLLGEATRAVLAGEPWHVTGALALRQAEQVREAHYDEDLWTDEVMGIVASMDEAGSTVTIPDILDRMDIPRAQQNTATQRRVANILKTNGYESVRRRAGGNNRFQRYWKKILPTAYE